MRRNRWRDDAGVSLTELLVSMAVFSILMAIVTSVMISLTYQSKDTLARTRALQEARLGVAQIDRQVRSGNVILNPALEDFDSSGVAPYFSMRIFTQEDGVDRCVQWRVIDTDEDGFGNLEFRSWDPQYPIVNEFTAWGAVANNLIEMDVVPTSESDILRHDPTTWPPFWVDGAASGDTIAQFVRITLRLKDPREREDSLPLSVSTVVTGRNTVFGYPASSCTNAPLASAS